MQGARVWKLRWIKRSVPLLAVASAMPAKRSGSSPQSSCRPCSTAQRMASLRRGLSVGVGFALALSVSARAATQSRKMCLRAFILILRRHVLIPTRSFVQSLGHIATIVQIWRVHHQRGGPWRALPRTYLSADACARFRTTRQSDPCYSTDSFVVGSLSLIRSANARISPASSWFTRTSS